MALGKRSRARKSLAKLSNDQRDELLSLVREGYREKPEKGYSVRYLARAIGVSKSTLYDWCEGPLQRELERVLAESRQERKHRNHPEVVPQGLGHVAVSEEMQRVLGDHPDHDDPPDHQDDHEQRREPHLSTREGDVVEDYHPEWRFGGVRSSLGIRSEPPRSPMIPIPPGYHGEKPNPPVFPVPLPPMVKNRRKGQAWYHDPNRK